MVRMLLLADVHVQDCISRTFADSSLAGQAAVGVVQKGLRPMLPPGTPQPLANIMGQCWVREPQARPSFESLKEQLEVSCS
jgi:Protein tyrosine and serine/threonine kinase